MGAITFAGMQHDPPGVSTASPEDNTTMTKQTKNKGGRPRKDPADKSKKHQVYLPPAVWHQAIETLEQELGVSGNSPGQVLAEALRRLVAGKWVPTQVEEK